MPEETAEQIAAREAAEAEAAAAAEAGAGAGSGEATGADEVTAARAEAEAARAAAAEAQANATAQEADLARRASELADRQLAFAEKAAKAGDKSFPPEVVTKLREEAAGQRTKRREAEEENQRLRDAAKSDVERETGLRTAAEKRADEAEAKLLRLTVGQKKNLPSDLAERLIGETQEDLEKDADKLLKTVTAPPATLDQGSRGGGQQPAAGSSGGKPGVRSMNDFIRSHGGRREVPGSTSATSA